MRCIRFLAAAALVGAVSGCDALDVQNPNDPDQRRILATPTDIEGFASAQFQQVISATLGTIARVQTGMMTASFMNASGLANNGMGPRSLIPRQPVDNNRGNAYSTENFTDYRILHAITRNTANILLRAKEPDFTLGPGLAGNETRLKAWAHFVSGVAHGYLSLVYDSAAIALPADDPLTPGPLVRYDEVNAFAIEMFDSALAYLNTTGAAAPTTLPTGWLTGAGGATVDTATFRRVIRTFRAKMRADVARTPEERAAVDWERVIQDATNGIQADVQVGLNPAQGWDYQWLATTLHHQNVNWHQMTYYIIGMADASGAFESWLASHRDLRTNFLIVTPDLRFPQGTTRAAQQADRGGDGVPTGGKYFRNRPTASDDPAASWRNSQYDHYRFRALANAGRIGFLPFLSRVENDMLAAEGHIRRGNIAAAATLIDRSRTVAGLPALSGVITDATQPVPTSTPGGRDCVPRVPGGPDFTTTACGTILEAMKWEKRIETAFTTYGAWFFDSRGWGDLAEGTPVHWPVPWQEADARSIPFYNTGGLGRARGAGPSTYGYGNVAGR